MHDFHPTEILQLPSNQPFIICAVAIYIVKEKLLLGAASAIIYNTRQVEQGPQDCCQWCHYERSLVLKEIFGAVRTVWKHTQQFQHENAFYIPMMMFEKPALQHCGVPCDLYCGKPSYKECQLFHKFCDVTSISLQSQRSHQPNLANGYLISGVFQNKALDWLSL